MLIEKTVSPLPARATVLFVSFSRTAVSQVVERAGPVVGPLLNRMDIVTFHGFAWRVVTDWGPAYGHPPPLRIQSEAEYRVHGPVEGSLRYAQLIPLALDILGNDAVSTYYRRRYALVICDEFQDTSDEEWRFTHAVAPTSRRILLGDVNQCIYAEMKRIDPELRVAQALRLSDAVRIDLPVTSHRDPTGLLPAAADAARERRFHDAALIGAVTGRRLVVTRIGAGARYQTAMEIIAAERSARQTVSVFTHTNAATTELSDALTENGVRHEQVGLSEAYGEALNAQAAMLRYALHGRPRPIGLRGVRRCESPGADPVGPADHAADEPSVRTRSVGRGRRPSRGVNPVGRRRARRRRLGRLRASRDAPWPGDVDPRRPSDAGGTASPPRRRAL